MEKIDRSDAEWRKQLTPEQYRVMREKGTERPFTGEYEKAKDKGMYVCAACGNPLFSSDTKYDSGSGWPSFYQPLTDTVEYIEDTSHGMKRVEVRCAHCGSHLGHVFPDGYGTPTGDRFCINSQFLRQRADLVCKRDLHRMPGVADVLGHLGGPE